MCSVFLYAQEPKIIGTVSGPDGSPIANASVKVKGTTLGTQTSEQGGFTIAAKKGDVLEVSSIGFKSLEVEVRNVSNLTIRLISTSSNLGEVIVVAMDIKRNPRELGYSAQKVSGAEIQENNARILSTVCREEWPALPLHLQPAPPVHHPASYSAVLIHFH